MSTCPVGKVPISGGPFMREEPSYCIDATEVTQAAYELYERAKFELIQRECGTSTASIVGRGNDPAALLNSKKRSLDGKNLCGLYVRPTVYTSTNRLKPIVPSSFLGPNKPKVDISFPEARAYCKAQDGDLPTSEQWEKAVRGPYGKEYGIKSSILNKKKSGANYASQGPVDVANYLPNDYGVYDGTGNVSEWTLEKDGIYYRVIRGGSWSHSDSVYLRASNRSILDNPGRRFLNVGFRCVSLPKD